MACVVPIQHADLNSVWLSLTGGFRCAHIASESAGRRVQTAELIITVQAATTAKERPVRGMMAAGQQTTTLIWLKFLISKKSLLETFGLIKMLDLIILPYCPSSGTDWAAFSNVEKQVIAILACWGMTTLPQACKRCLSLSLWDMLSQCSIPIELLTFQDSKPRLWLKALESCAKKLHQRAKIIQLISGQKPCSDCTLLYSYYIVLTHEILLVPTTAA